MESVDLALNLDPRGYVQGAGAAANATAQLVAGQASIQRGAGAVETALRVMTPKALTASFVAFTAVAAGTEQRLAGMQATAAVTGQSMGRLTKTMNDLARTFPVGNRGAQQIVQGLQAAGFSAAGQEKKLAGLAQSVTRLGAATGEEASSIGRNLVTLNRAFGNTEMDPARFNKMSDSLVTLSAKSGTSASSILDFSKSIAPLARSAGIGQTNVMGISTAFAKLGEDGFAASNTMNKVLSDLNRSLRDGTPELNTYANIVGKTREEFESLAKTNMPEAVSQVFEAIGSAGPGQGQRLLEDIGIEGVRGQRAIQAVTQAGGLRQFQNEATNAYGNGNTAKAAEEAMDGLTDSMERLGSSSEQIAAAFGTPLLGALTKFTDQLASVTGFLAKVMSSGPVQMLMKGAGALAGGLGAIAGIAAAGFAVNRLARGGAMVAALTARNAPVQAMRAAARQARGRDVTPAQQRLLGRVAADNDPNRLRRIASLQALADRGQATPAQLARLNTLQQQGVQGGVRGLTGRLAALGTAYGEQRAANAAARPAPVAGAPRGAGVLRTVTAYGTALGRGMRTMNDDFVQQQRQEAGTRRSSLRFGADQWTGQNRSGGPDEKAGGRSGWGGRLFDEAKKAATGVQSMGDRAKHMGNALRATHKDIVGNQSSLRMLSGAAANTAKSMTMSAGLIAKAGMAAGGAAMGGLARLGGGAMGMIGGPAGLAMVGAMVGGMAYSSNKQAQKDRLAADNEASITGTRDRYLESMGKAADATMSFAAQAQQAATALARTTPGDAHSVDAAEREAARTGSVVQNYAGDARTVAEQINAQYGGKITDQELSAITTDLLRTGQNDGEGFSESTVNDILAGIRRETGTSPHAAPGGVGVDYNALLAQAGEAQEGTSIKQNVWRSLTGAEGDTGGGWKNTVRDAVFGKEGTGLAGLPWVGDKLEVGGAWNGIATTKEQEAAISSVREGIAQNELRQTDTYGADYARQESYKEINSAMQAAMETGNADLVARMSEQLSAQAGAKGQVVDRDLLDKHDGDFIAALAEQDRGFRKQYEQQQARGISTSGEGISATVQDSPMTTLLDGVNLFGEAVSNRADDIDKDVNKALMAFREMPGDLARFQKALDAVTQEAMTSAGGLQGGMQGAIETMNKIGDPNNPIFKVAEASLREFERLQQANVPFQSTGTTLRQQMEGGLLKAQNGAAGDPSNPANAALIREGREQVVNARNQAAEIMKQRIMAEIQFQRSMARSQEDYNLQRAYAEEDFERSMARTREDYGIQRARQIANFNRQVARATEDFHRGQQRAQRDFNIQMQRMNEDAAKAMYDPYKRIQVQAIYDMGTLMVNLREQNEAMRRQAATLENLRGMGLSNDAIDQLGLNKAENAQQAERLAADLAAGGAGAVEELNRATAERMAAGATLFQDQSNKDLARQREDFNRAMADQNEDFARSMARQREDFNRGLSEMAADFGRSMARAEADQARSMDRMATAFQKSMQRARDDHALAQKEIHGDYVQLQKQMSDALQGNIKTATGAMVDTAKSAIKEIDAVLKSMTPEMRKMILSDGIIQITMEKGSMSEARAANEHQFHRNKGGLDSEETTSSGGLAGLVQGGGRVTSEFGYRRHPITGERKLHAGIDIGAPNGKAVYAYGAGRVVHSGWAGGYGNAIYIDHGAGRVTRYAHLSSLIAGRGTNVGKGQPVGRVGSTGASTGNHLHFEKRVAGNPINPRHGFDKGGVVTRPTEALIGEAGVKEAVIPLNSGGVDVIARALSRYMDMSRLSGVAAGQARTHVTYQTTVTNNDMRTEVLGEIKVVSNDPNDMARQLAAKARRDNLGRTPTQRSR